MNIEFYSAVKEKAHYSGVRECFWVDDDSAHEGCEVTTYSVSVIMTYGSDKSHRMNYIHHSATDQLLGGSRPACGSKQFGAPQCYNMRAERPTCGRC